MKFENIGRLEEYVPVKMHDNLLDLYANNSPGSPRASHAYKRVLLQWEDKVVYIKSYDFDTDGIYTDDGEETWNIYPWLIERLINEEENPEYFL